MTDRPTSPHLTRPLHPDVADTLIRALNAFPYSAAVQDDLPSGLWTDLEHVTGADIERGVRALADVVQRAADEARQAAERLHRLERDIQGIRRLLGLEVPQRYITGMPQ